MLQTKLGPFNGKTWEDLCQLVFKKKYANDGYQQMPASPGDFGLEGFTLRSCLGFQCYCPDKHYTSTELYEKQRDKITEDLGKLKKYETEIAGRIGTIKIRDWHFTTPEFERNALHAHARKKEQEVRAWNLTILDPDFTIHLRDADYYLTEINEVRSLNGQALNFDTCIPLLPALNGPPEEYESNLKRKTDLRLAHKTGSPSLPHLVSTLYGSTLTTFLEHDGLLRRIEKGAPPVYFRLLRIVAEYEISVKELGTIWSGSAEELLEKVRDGLSARIASELGPDIDQTTASQIARHMVARWLAVCQLDFT
jgi:hypothetical protein